MCVDRLINQLETPFGSQIAWSAALCIHAIGSMVAALCTHVCAEFDCFIARVQSDDLDDHCTRAHGAQRCCHGSKAFLCCHHGPPLFIPAACQYWRHHCHVRRPNALHRACEETALFALARRLCRATPPCSLRYQRAPAGAWSELYSIA
jgi:hypothetical protein